MKKIQKNYLGWGLVAILALIPVVLWLFGTRFHSNSIFVDYLSYIGQLTALVGTALFAVSLIMSGRFHWLENIFKGLNEVYLQHHKIGQVALILLLLHPLFLIAKYASGTWAGAAIFLLPGSDWAKSWGFYGLALMLGALILTLYLSLAMKYNIWKFTHKFLGLAFFLASIHVWFIPSDTSRNMPLRYYMLTLSFMVLGVFVYYSLLGKYFVKKYKYVVVGVNKLNDKVIRIEMKSVGRKMSYQDGQFAFFSFQTNLQKESHPFTISSAPTEENLVITVKKLGDFTSDLFNLKLDTEVLVHGPFGIFNYHNSISKKQVWIGGGIGVTPFLSMLKSMDANEDYEIDFYYIVSSEEEIIDKGLLQQLPAVKNSKIKLNFYVSSASGRFTIDNLAKLTDVDNTKDYFICAPKGMITSIKDGLLKKGVNKKLIHSEEFGL